MKKLAVSCLVLISLASPVCAQNKPFGSEQSSGQNENQGDQPTNDRFWSACLPGGCYMVQLDRISSISRHSYLLDGAVVVDEVTVDALGQALARFYHLRPLTDLASDSGTGAAASRIVNRARDLVDNAAERFGSNPTEMVVKKYPETTHARTIEYRLETQNQLTRLYNSVKIAWETGKGRSFTIK